MTDTKLAAAMLREYAQFITGEYADRIEAQALALEQSVVGEVSDAMVRRACDAYDTLPTEGYLEPANYPAMHRALAAAHVPRGSAEVAARANADKWHSLALSWGADEAAAMESARIAFHEAWIAAAQGESNE